ncbi:MAG TPA: DMT family transporter [Vicinamibacteria bacterium]|jgi:drug/metabolite transporter (DMT)-like permease
MNRSAYLPLALAVLLVSFGSIFIRLAAAPPLAVSFYRIALAAACLSPLAAGEALRSWPRLSRRQGLVLALSGIVLALHFATWIASLSSTSIASSVLLVNTAPLFAVGLTRLFLHERVAPAVLAAIAVAFLGAALIAYGDWTGSPGSLAGNLLALAGAVTLAAYHVIGRGLREALPLPAYLLGVWSTAAIVLAALAAAYRVPFAGYSTRTYLLFLALALVPTLGGHGLVNYSLRRLSAPTVGLFLLGEPLGASLLAYFAFGEVPGAWTWAGGILVIVALAVVLRRS